MWRYVKSASPSRRYRYSDTTGSFTFNSRSLSPQTSSTDAIRAPTRWYASSAKALPAPAPVSTTTSWPWLRSSSAPAGVRATRYSSDLISFATPTLKAAQRYPSQPVFIEPAVHRRPETCSTLFTVAAHIRAGFGDTLAVEGGGTAPHPGRGWKRTERFAR